jgi:hypothetical protein
LMADLASHVVNAFEAGHPEDAQPAFNLAEQLIAKGAEPDRRAAIVGFLETVQNVASHRQCGTSAFEIYLGPLSRKAWAELNEIWKDKATLAEVVAAETGAKLAPPWWQFCKKREKRTPKQLLDEVENPELRKLIEQITRE